MTPQTKVSSLLGTAVLSITLLIAVTLIQQERGSLVIYPGDQLAAISGAGSGLVAQYTFDNDSGTTATDSSGNGLNGTINNMTAGPMLGKVGQALNFNTWAYVNVPDPASEVLDFGTNSFSISMWEFSLPGGNDHEASLWKGGYMIKHGWATGGSNAVGVLSDGTISKEISFGAKNLLNTWTLLTLVVDRNSNTMKTYVDGSYTGISTDITGLGSVSTGHPLRIGMGDNWLPYNGGIDEVNIYNRVLTDSEIQELYNQGAGRASLVVTIDPASTGSGTVTGGLINCGSLCFQTVNVGNSVTITANPTGTSKVESISYPGCSGTAPCTIPITSNVNVTVKFRDPTQEAVSLNPATCAQADVQAAINAAQNGNTIIVPPGECEWGALAVNKPITLSGSGRDVTIINVPTWPDASQYGSTGSVINISAAATVKSFTVKVPSTPSIPIFSVSANGFRISDIKRVGLSTVGGYFLYTSGYGLVDNVDVTGEAGNDEMIFARGPTNSWQTSNSMGGEDNLFIENSTFRNSGYVTDCNSNSRCVVRYNTITGSIKIDGHGKASNSPARGVRHMEIYGNRWTAPSGVWAAMEIRGGSGRIFNNIEDSGDFGGFLFLTDYAASAAWPNFGYVIQTAANYPIDDQIGVGRDPKVGASEPMYLWSNTKGGSPWPIGLGWGPVPAYMPQVIAADRDYFNEAPFFDGTSGVGVGSKSRMNSIRPTKVGVGFWVTDEGNWNTSTPGADGQLYTWNGSSWVLAYVPYQYPHPKAVGSIVPPTVIQPPPPVVTPVNGSCGTATNTCTAGTFVDVTDSSSQNLWQCQGSNSGSAASCSSTITTTPTTPPSSTPNPTTPPTTTASSYTVSVTNSGSGTGIVSGGNIYCGTACSVTLDPGSSITLRATPSSGSTFVGWSGSCMSSSMECVLNVNSDLSVGAVFNTTSVTPVTPNPATPPPPVSAGDTTAPSVPNSVLASSITKNSVVLAWARSTDNVGVTGYRVYKNGALVGSPLTNSHTVSGLSAGTKYTFTVAAMDAAQNVSPQSSPISVTTEKNITTTYSLQIDRTGLGAVYGSGLYCGSNCYTILRSGTDIVLGQDSKEGYRFTGWTGACQGQGVCRFKLTADTVVGATFAPKSSSPTQSSSSTPKPVTTLTKNLYLGVSDSQVKTLQSILNQKGYTVATTGAGSVGNESEYFGRTTEAAVKKFQCSVMSICSGNMLTTGYGFVGAKTRAALLAN